MLGITDLSTYLIGVVLIVLLPGPNSLYVLSVSARRGVRSAYSAAAGVWTGDAVLMAVSAAGVASLLKANPIGFSVIKYAGALYLVWLAIGMLRGAWRMWREHRAGASMLHAAQRASTEHLPEPGRRRERPYRRALTLSLLNPKAILFFVAFFVQFVDPGYAYPAVAFVVLGSFAQLASMLYLSVIIFTGSWLSETFRRHRVLSAFGSSATGAIFIGFAVKLSMA